MGDLVPVYPDIGDKIVVISFSGLSEKEEERYGKCVGRVATVIAASGRPGPGSRDLIVDFGETELGRAVRLFPGDEWRLVSVV